MADVGELVIRPVGAGDSIAMLTELLHRAYASLSAMGLNFTAVDQPEAVTQRRVERGYCFVAVVGDALVGTVTVYPPGRVLVCDWYRRAGTAVFGQIAVLPERQHDGIGGQLLERAEQHAHELGASDLACDTAEPAVHLIEWYSRRGYRAVDHVQWEGKTYRSVVLSKPLGNRVP
jgi:GNAT superfamily N-acetyltransferase